MDSKEVSLKDATLNLHQQTAYPSPSLISSLDTEGAQSMHITPTANKRTFHAAFPPSTLFFSERAIISKNWHETVGETKPNPSLPPCALHVRKPLTYPRSGALSWGVSEGH